MNCGDREYSLSCTLNSIITTSSDAFFGSPPVSKRLNILAVTLFICILKLFYWTHIIILIEVREWGNTALTVSNLKSSSSRIPSGIFQIIQLAVFSCPHIPLFGAKWMHGCHLEELARLTQIFMRCCASEKRPEKETKKRKPLLHGICIHVATVLCWWYLV